MNYVIVFHTQSGAIKFDNKMKKLGIPCSLQPVPRKLSSSCGICAKLTYSGNTEKLIEAEIDKIYRELSFNQYELLYENE